MDEHHVRSCATAGDAIGMNSEWLSYFRTLISGPYDKFLEAQFNKAVANRDDNRACRAAMKRKDLVVQQSGQNLELNRVSF